MKIVLRDKTEVTAKIEPMFLWQLWEAYQKNILVVAIKVFRGDKQFFASVQDIDFAATEIVSDALFPRPSMWPST